MVWVEVEGQFVVSAAHRGGGTRRGRGRISTACPTWPTTNATDPPIIPGRIVPMPLLGRFAAEVVFELFHHPARPFDFAEALE